MRNALILFTESPKGRARFSLPQWNVRMGVVYLWAIRDSIPLPSLCDSLNLKPDNPNQFHFMPLGGHSGPVKSTMILLFAGKRTFGGSLQKTLFLRPFKLEKIEVINYWNDFSSQNLSIKSQVIGEYVLNQFRIARS